MNIKVSEALSLSANLPAFMAMDMPINLSVKAVNISSALDVVVEQFNKRKQSLFEEFGEPEGDGYIIKDSSKIPLFNAEINSSADELVDIEVIKFEIHEIVQGIPTMKPEVLKGIMLVVNQ